MKIIGVEPGGWNLRFKKSKSPHNAMNILFGFSLDPQKKNQTTATQKLAIYNNIL